MERPPCWPEGRPCPNPCAAANYQRQVYNHTPLHGPWTGWRMAGQRLISPDREWIAPHTLDRLMYRETVLFRYDRPMRDPTPRNAAATRSR